jgi:Big-like domain-containing protein
MFIPRYFFLVVLALGFSTQALSQCSGSMAITNPTEHATVNSHFQISAAASSSCSITTLHVYIDDKLQFAQYGQAVLSGKFNAGIGTHQIVVQAWASDGKVFSKTVHVSVNKEVTSSCLPAFDPNVNVCAPVNLSETKGTVLVHAAARSSISPVVLLQAFAGGTLKAASYNDNASEMEAALTLPRGIQNLNLVARSSNGSEFHNEANVQIVSTAANCQPPFISNIVPTPGDAPEFPPFLAAADAAACSITTFQVYVDGRLFYSQSNQKIFEGRLTLEPGTHNVVLQAWNNQGAVSKKSIKINVFGLQEPTCLPAPGVGICVGLAGQVENNGYAMIFAAQPGAPAVAASPFTALRIYVDSVSRATFYNFTAQEGITALHMTRGTHNVKAVGWTQQGSVVSDTTLITVP